MLGYRRPSAAQALRVARCYGAVMRMNCSTRPRPPCGGCSRPNRATPRCYFHRAPRPFVGGDLLLHDAGRAGAFSRIEPLPGSIVFFPSGCLHEITPVACGAEFGDGRFTVQGWVSPRGSVGR